MSESLFTLAPVPFTYVLDGNSIPKTGSAVRKSDNAFYIGGVWVGRADSISWDVNGDIAITYKPKVIQ